MTQAFANSGQTNLEPFMKQILLPRVGQPKDFADAVAYLASDDAAYVTGTVLHVDGGLCALQPSVAYFEAMTATAGSLSAAHSLIVPFARGGAIRSKFYPWPS